MTDEYEVLRKLAGGAEIANTPENRVLTDQFGLETVIKGDCLGLLEPLELLDPDVLYSEITGASHEHLSRLDLLWTTESTNSHVMSFGKSSEFHGYVCAAEQQTAGRGRRGRSWISPFGKNIYLTLGWLMPSDRSVDGLSLAVGTAVVAAIQSVSTASVQLKWPNDVLISGGKAAGILIEIASGPGPERRLVIGVGINLQLSSTDADSIDQPWSVIEGVSRNKLAAALVSELVSVLRDFTSNGFWQFKARWESLDAHFGQSVRLIASDKATVGLNRGVDSSGQLLLETPEGLLSFNAGEVSLRPLA
jgi:BirA family biotin operon repressor/biotin-[acetyl-CoA-carboxylase] ligase